MIVDSDTHINEELEVLERFLEEPYTSRRPRIIKDTLGLTRILLEGRLYPEPRLKQAHTKKVEGKKLGGTHAGASDAKARLADLDQEGIDVQVIYGSLGLALSTLADKDFAAALSRACNNYYADFCSVDPERLKAMATLPLQDIPASIEEIKRAKDVGLIGITMPPNVNGKNLDHPDFYPIYESAQKLDLPIAIHWGNGAYLTAAGTERFNTHFMVHAIGHPFEQMIALATLVCGGILELFPNLRFAFLEAGCGWLPYWVERLDEHYERRTAEMPLMKREPIDYVTSGSCYFATEPDERMLPAVLRTIGDDYVLFSSDYPHTDSKFPFSVKYIRERVDVTEASKAKVLSANGAKFYRLQTDKATASDR